MRRVGEIRSWIEAFEAVDAATQEVALAYDFYKEEAVEEQDVDLSLIHIFYSSSVSLSCKL